MYEAGWNFSGKVIGVVVTRRIAAVSISNYLSRTITKANEIGYRIRFSDTTNPSTKVLFITDGCILREILRDPLLTNYSVIIIDDAHERTVNTDILLSLLKK